MRENSMSDEVKNVVLCGVGGQGTILASKILSSCLIDAGYDVKMSEIHGMIIEASRCRREECDLSELILGIECGGSDATSGLASNPVMSVLGEALGLGISGSGLIPAVYNERRRCAFKSGEMAVELVKNDVTSRKILTWNAIENAIMIVGNLLYHPSAKKTKDAA